jgi:hypothetical protein
VLQAHIAGVVFMDVATTILLKALVWFWMIDETLVLTFDLSV